MKRKILSVILSCTVILTVLLPFSVLTLSLHANAVSYSADPNWYNANKSILEINDIPDFIAFMQKMNELGTTDDGTAVGAAGNLAAISWSGKMPFEGQTIILNTDIVLNPGITFSASGPSDTSAYKFTRTKNVGFGGIFDGQGHTISGLYISASKGAAGSLFGVGGAPKKQMNVVVRNLQIKNSLIQNSAMGVASIFSAAAFDSNVLIENVYSEANLLCTNTQVTASDSHLKVPFIGVNIGGFCATVGGHLTIDSSIYAGTIATKDTSTTVKKYIGGMVGNVAAREFGGSRHAANLTLENSAFYGKYQGRCIYMGKLAGGQVADTTVTADRCIFGGDMKPINSATPNYIGRFIGMCTSRYTIKISKSEYTPMYYSGTTTSVAANYNKISDPNSGTAIEMNILIDANIKGEKASLHEYINLHWVSNGTREGYPVPASYIALFGKESLKHSYVTELPLTARDLFEQLGTKIANDGIYTKDSYRRYSDAYDAIVAMIFAEDANLSEINVPELKANAEALLLTPADEKRIELKAALGEKIDNSNGYYTEESYSSYSNAYDEIVKSLDDATTVEALNKIDVPTLKSNAEALLMTPADEKRAELKATLGEKIDNSNGYYTEESYSKYSNAYDEIVKSLDDATTVEALNKIDVPTLKSNAEALLEKYVPKVETDAPETDAPETDAPPTSIGCGGCGSAAALSAFAFVAIIGAALVTKKKD